MEIREFRNGDRVKHNIKGKGTIIDYISRGNIGVEFETLLTMGHDCGGKGRMGYCWYVGANNLELINELPFDVGEFIDELEVLEEGIEKTPYHIGHGHITDNNPFTPQTGFRIPKKKNESEGKPLKLNELTQGVPLLGLRVMINPEKYERYNQKYHGQSGIITNLRGSERDAYRQITRYKQNGRAEGWSVTVRFDDERETDVSIQDLLPIIPEKEVILHELKFDGGDYYTWSQEVYDQHIDKYVIAYQYGIKVHKMWNDEERQKVLDAH